MLATNDTLRTLHLASNRIGTPGAVALADGLKTNSTLSTLFLGDNSIGPEGGTALGSMLITNTGLTEVSLWRNTALSVCPQLTLLSRSACGGTRLTSAAAARWLRRWCPLPAGCGS